MKSESGTGLNAVRWNLSVFFNLISSQSLSVWGKLCNMLKYWHHGIGFRLLSTLMFKLQSTSLNFENKSSKTIIVVHILVECR